MHLQDAVIFIQTAAPPSQELDVCPLEIDLGDLQCVVYAVEEL